MIEKRVINGIEVPGAGLAQSRAHHVAMGSSSGSRKPEEYHKTKAELMNDEELRKYVENELGLIREEHA